MSLDNSTSSPIIEISSRSPRAYHRIQEVWMYRELLGFLIWRDLKVRYKQTVLGGLWAILQPLTIMVLFTLFFGRLAKMPSDGKPYALFAYVALVPWLLFANSLQMSSQSLVANAGLWTKVYFPRLIVPLATAFSGVFDFFIATFLLVCALPFFGFFPTLSWLLIPFLFLLLISLCVGVSLWLSALNVFYRDVRFVVPFMVQAWLFATPVAYPSTLMNETWRCVYAINPMVSIVEGSRYVFLNTSALSFEMLFVSFLSTILITVSGMLYFNRMDRFFSDVV